MMLNPGQVNPIQGNWGNSGAPGIGNQIGGGFGLAAYGANPQALGAQPGFNLAVMAGNPIDDVADDIAERISNEITDQAATAAAALFQSQAQQQSAQPVSGLNAKRWLNANRTTDAVKESVKQNVHQLCRQVVVQLLTQLQSQASGAWQQLGGYGQSGYGQGGYGQIGGFGQIGQPGLAAFGGNGALYSQPFQQPFQQSVAQLAPVVASILSTLQANGQGHGGSQFGLPGRLN